MPDDPREILKAAGVECAEVDLAMLSLDDNWSDIDEGDVRSAILALARLVAKYKWDRDEFREMFEDANWSVDDMTWDEFVGSLDRRWKEREAKP